MESWMAQGGIVLKILIVLNGIGWSIMIWKAISIYLFNKRIDSQQTTFMNGLKQYGKGEFTISNEEKIAMALSHYMDPFHKGMDTVKVIASIAPLLGLLGTVVGILSSFTVIAQKGLDNPALFAEGISMALVTTVGGLIVAIPHFIGHNYLKGFLIRSEKKLEKRLVY